METDSIYRGLLGVTEPYLSTPSVEATLKVVMKKMGLSPATLRPDELPRLIAEAMIGLRLLCDKSRLPELMVDLAEYCEAVADDA